MPRVPRIDIGGQIYHIINRANGRQTIFHKKEDYIHFEKLLAEAKKKFDMRIVAYVLMPNHWHLVLCPKHDGDLSAFMQWLTLTHTQQYHSKKQSIGYGHIYQGRYKSFLIDKDNYLLTVIKYVERNPVRAKLAKRVEQWRWGSGYRRLYGTTKEKEILSQPLVQLPKNHRSWVNELDNSEELDNVRLSVNKSKPFGTTKWIKRIVERFGLGITMRGRGRPKKGT